MSLKKCSGSNKEPRTVKNYDGYWHYCKVCGREWHTNSSYPSMTIPYHFDKRDLYAPTKKGRNDGA